MGTVWQSCDIKYPSIFSCFCYSDFYSGWKSADDYSCSRDCFMRKVNQLLTMITEAWPRRNDLNWSSRSQSYMGVIIMMIGIVVHRSFSPSKLSVTENKASFLGRRQDTRRHNTRNQGNVLIAEFMKQGHGPVPQSNLLIFKNGWLQKAWKMGWLIHAHI